MDDYLEKLKATNDPSREDRFNCRYHFGLTTR